MSNKIRGSAKITWGLNGNVAGTIDRSAMESAILYAGEIWADTCKIKEINRSAEIVGTVMSANVYSSTSTDAACIISGVLPVDLGLRRFKFRRDTNKIGFEGLITLMGIELESQDVEGRVGIRVRIHSIELRNITYNKFICALARV